jgi:hypothetical protein
MPDPVESTRAPPPILPQRGMSNSAAGGIFLAAVVLLCGIGWFFSAQRDLSPPDPPTAPSASDFPTIKRRGVEVAAPAEPAPVPTPGSGPIAPGRQRAYLGAVVDKDKDPGRGVRVLVVRPGGPAERAGVRPQDLIVAAAGAQVRQLSDMVAVMDRASPGDSLAIEVLRGVSPRKLMVTLGRQPAAVAPVK